MNQDPIFTFDSENGIAECIIQDNKGEVYLGHAHCHPEDKDMMSEKTGCEIAYRRAQIQFLKHYRDYELKPALAALKQLYFSMNRSKFFNEKSYENRMLQRQIRLKEFDLTTTNEIIVQKKENIKTYIDEKEKFYQQIRKNRK